MTRSENNMYCIKFIKNPCAFGAGEYCKSNLGHSKTPFDLGSINAAFQKLEELWKYHQKVAGNNCDCIFEVVEV